MPEISSKKFKKKVSTVLTALAVIVTALLLIVGLFLRIELIRQNDKNVALSDELHDMREENKRLRIKYESSLDLTKIEDYAKNVLGMRKPNKGQMKKIDSGAYTDTETDRADDEGDISDKFEYWLSCIFKS